MGSGIVFQIFIALIRVLALLARIARPLLDCLEAAVFRFIHGKKQDLPPITNRLLMLSATQLAERIRKKQVSCAEVMRVYQDRIKQVNPFLNAMVDQRFDEAMEEARAVDDLLRSDSKTVDDIARETPLLGVPFTCKEAIAIKGLYNTSGLVERKGIRADNDSDIVKLYRRAGAIPYASTNIPEVCLWSESSNHLYGVTNNPHDLYRTCGGSSGGEGAAISSAGSIIGIGNDLGGSIRIPAAFNGIFGHKPTIGVLSNKGAYPPITGKVDDMWQCGPLCRFADDILVVMKAVAGEDKRLRLSEKVDLKNVKFYYMEDNGSFMNAATSDIKNAVKKAAAHFEQKLGASVERISIAELKHSFDLWVCKYVQCNPPLMVTMMADMKGRVQPLWEFLKWTVGCSEHTLPAIYFALTEDRTEGEYHHKMAKMLKNLESKMADLLSGNAVFLYPTSPEPAHHNHMGILRFSNVQYTGIFNVLGYPATQIPAGLSKGLPIGVQAVSGRFNDHLTIATAIELEKVFNGWTSPCPVILKDE